MFQSEIQKLTSNILISEDKGQFTIMIDIQGTDEVPVAIELGFSLGGELHGVLKLDEIPNTYLLTNEWGEYHFQNQAIRFGPGQTLHSWIQIRGALPKLNAMSVYLTGFTPFKTTFTIL